MTADSVPGVSWIAFEHADGETWMFDLAFFSSNWNCIYGSGCQGIEEQPAPDAHRGCCSYGAHFADDADLQRVMQIAAVLPADVWQHHALRDDHVDEASSDPEALVDALTQLDGEGDRTTVVVDGACVFLNRPGFHRGPGCALHVAAADAEIEPLEWKPEVCWQVPVRVEHHIDDNNHLTHMVRPWSRRDWGQSGADLGWWCIEAPEAYEGAESVAGYLRAEVVALAGDEIADALIDHVSGHGVSVSFPSRRS